MIELGAALAALSVALLIASSLGASRVASRLEAIVRASGRTPVATGLAAFTRPLGGARSVTVRVLLSCAAALVLMAGGAALLAPAAAYAAFVAPTVVADRRAARSLRDAERATVMAVEWADALVAAGRPAGPAVLAIAREGTGASRLDAVLRSTAAAAALGAPLFRVFAAEARGAGLGALAALAEDLERSRDLGQGSRAALRDARDELRRRERARAIDLSSRVDGKLVLVLVLCYLPALMLVVLVPLFVGLLSGIAG